MASPAAPVRRMLLTVLGLSIAGYALACVAMALFQKRLIYFPSRALFASPAELGLDFEELDVETADGLTLGAWLVCPGGEPRGAVLVCNGNAGNMGARVEYAAAFAAMGYCVLLFDYRGYGRSEGSPDEEGTYRDAEAAFDALSVASGLPPERIAVYGESLGGAMAIELAARRTVAAVAVENTFTSLPDLGAGYYPWLPVRWLAQVRYANLDKLAALDAPLLVIHTPGDEIVPFAHGERLFECANEPKTMLVTAGSHNDGGFLMREEWRESVRGFLDAACGE